MLWAIRDEQFRVINRQVEREVRSKGAKMYENKVLVGGFLKEEEVVYFCDGTPHLKFKLEIEASPKPDIPSYGIDCFYELDSTRDWGDFKLGEAMKTYLIVNGRLGVCSFPDESASVKKGAIIIAESIQIYRNLTDIDALMKEYPFKLMSPKMPEMPKAFQIPEPDDEDEEDV